MRIIVRVRDLRKAHNLTQEELAKQLNISRQSLISLEQGRWLPSLPLAIQLAQFFNTPLEQVITGGEKMKEIEPKEEVIMASRDINNWSPFNEMRSMRDEMERMIDQSGRFPLGTATVFPTINIKQDAKHVILEAHVPGYSNDELDIDVADDMVTISGSSSSEKSEDGTDGGYLRREYQQQSFSRTVPLPFAVMSDEAQAKLKDGVLTVTVPKITEEKTKSKRLKPTAE